MGKSVEDIMVESDRLKDSLKKIERAAQKQAANDRLKEENVKIRLALNPMKYPHGTRDQFGVLGLKKQGEAFGEVPYRLLKTAESYRKATYNLRKAYDFLGEAIWGNHVEQNERRFIKVREPVTSNYIATYSWGVSRQSAWEVPNVVLEIIAEAFKGADRVECRGPALGFCLHSERIVFGVVPYEFIQDCEQVTEVERHLRQAYEQLRHWGGLKMGWIVKYKKAAGAKSLCALVVIDENKNHADVFESVDRIGEKLSGSIDAARSKKLEATAKRRQEPINDK